MKTNVKPRNMYAEYTILTKYFGTESMSMWFNNYEGYADARERATYQQVFDTLSEMVQVLLYMRMDINKTQMIETILYGCKIGEPNYMEEILYHCKGYTNKEKLMAKGKEWAKANGYDRLRIAEIDLMQKPDFTKTINI